MTRFCRIAALSALLSTSAVAVAQDAPLPIVAQPQAQAPQTALPANTELVVALNSELSSKTVNAGDTFSATVQQDVLLGGYVVIPRGSRAVGEVTWKTGKGAFGKSGKMEVEMRYVDVGGRRVPIEGKFRQEGEGNTVATVAGVVAAGVFAGFITGKTAVMPRGRELTVRTSEAVPVALPAHAAPAYAAPAYAAAQRAPAAVHPAPVLASVAGGAGSFERRAGESCSDYARRVRGNSPARKVIEDSCQARQ